jgi:hypothetical protein
MFDNIPNGSNICDTYILIYGMIYNNNQRSATLLQNVTALHVIAFVMLSET